MFKHTSFQASQPLRFREHYRSITLKAGEQVNTYNRHGTQGQTGKSLCHGLCRIGMRVLRVLDLTNI
jgi:hypothetical protein